MLENSQLQLLQDFWICSRHTKAENKAFNNFYNELLKIAKSKAHYLFPARDWDIIALDAVANFTSSYFKNPNRRYKAFRDGIHKAVISVALYPPEVLYSSRISFFDDLSSVPNESIWQVKEDDPYDIDPVEDLCSSHPLGWMIVLDCKFARSKKDLGKRLTKYISEGFIRRHITPICRIYESTRRL